MNLPAIKSQRGQGMTEYIIIVALIAVAAIGSFRYFGQTARQQAAAAATEVSGGNGTAQTTAAQTAAGEAVNQADQNKSMGTFNGNNSGQN